MSIDPNSSASMFSFCQCQCHQSSITGGNSWCNQCAAVHGQISITTNTTFDYDSEIYSTLCEIRTILTDIKTLLEKKDSGRRGTKSRKINRPNTRTSLLE